MRVYFFIYLVAVLIMVLVVGLFFLLGCVAFAYTVPRAWKEV